jgi:hypothetical protein
MGPRYLMVASLKCYFLWLAILGEREPARKCPTVVNCRACDVDQFVGVNELLRARAHLGLRRDNTSQHPSRATTANTRCTSLAASCERPSSLTMPVDRLLATLLRSLQTYTDQQDTPRSVVPVACAMHRYTDKLQDTRHDNFTSHDSGKPA